jgi:hypothetical protein
MDPPTLVIELGTPARASLVGQWCAVVGTRYVATLQASEAMRAIAANDAPAPAPAGLSSHWKASLDTLMASAR